MVKIATQVAGLVMGIGGMVGMVGSGKPVERSTGLDFLESAWTSTQFTQPMRGTWWGVW